MIVHIIELIATLPPSLLFSLCIAFLNYQRVCLFIGISTLGCQGTLQAAIAHSMIGTP